MWYAAGIVIGLFFLVMLWAETKSPSKPTPAEKLARFMDKVQADRARRDEEVYKWRMRR